LVCIGLALNKILRKNEEGTFIAMLLQIQYKYDYKYNINTYFVETFMALGYIGPIRNRDSGHTLATGFPAMFFSGNTPKTRLSTETALQSPNT